jgi:hypothetical protein
VADVTAWAPLITAFGGVSGLVMVMRLWSDHGSHEKDLAVALNSTARDWVRYIDEKFDEASIELERFKSEQRQRDKDRQISNLTHQQWDMRILHHLMETTGESFDDPPPLDCK